MSFRTVVPGEFVDWHAHWHHELCLTLEGKPTVGWAGGKVFPEVDTLFLFKESEAHGFWNSASVPARLWSLEFDIRSNLKTQFRELFELSPQRRVLKLSADRRKGFCTACQKLALEKGACGFLNALAASAWLALQLVNVTRWLADSEGHLPDVAEEIDPQCFELWQKIHRNIYQPTSCGAMLFGLDPCHDSLRHRFRKLFGSSPQAMLTRLRIDRAKELLRTSTLSIKEIAYELGYSRQHDLTRAFHRYSGESPSEWKMRSNGLKPREEDPRRQSDASQIRPDYPRAPLDYPA